MIHRDAVNCSRENLSQDVFDVKVSDKGVAKHLGTLPFEGSSLTV